MKALIRVNMFTLAQNVYLKGEHGTAEYKLQLSEIPKFLMAYEDLTDVYIYGSEQFTKKLVTEIKQEELNKYNCNKINIKLDA